MFWISHMIICRQFSKMNISCYKREKSHKKHRETGRETSKEFVQKNFLIYFIDRHLAWYWIIFYL